MEAFWITNIKPAKIITPICLKEEEENYDEYDVPDSYYEHPLCNGPANHYSSPNFSWTPMETPNSETFEEPEIVEIDVS